MELTAFFQSIVAQDEQPVVICDMAHTIVYMNPAAIDRYESRGGAALVGRSLMGCHSAASAAAIERVCAWFREDAAHDRVFTYHKAAEDADVYMIALRDAEGRLIGYYEKHESRAHETAAPYTME